MTTVLIADDHPMMRAGVRQILSEDPTITQVEEADSGTQTLRRLRSGRWNVLLLDINMPDRNGLDILQQVVERYPDTKVLVLSGFSERSYALAVLRAGASGYVPKESAPERLLGAIHTVMKGRHHLGSEIAELLASGCVDADSARPAHSCLSQREFQVFYKIAKGRTVSSIGNELCLSAKTVSTYRSNILEKMRLQNNADITIYALRNNLI
jgi:DNA-binding NarL/FixJ family response regulator